MTEQGTVITPLPVESRPPQEQGASAASGQKTLLEQTRDLVAKTETLMQQMRNAERPPDESMKQELKRTNVQVQNLLNQLKHPSNESQTRFLPAVTRRIISVVNTQELRPESSPAMLLLLQRSIDGTNLNATSGIIHVADEICGMQALDREVSRQILKGMHARLVEEGMSAEDPKMKQYEQVIHAGEPSREQPDRAAIAQARTRALADTKRNNEVIRHAAVNTVRLRAKVEAELRKTNAEELQKGALSESALQDLIAKSVEREVSAIQGRIAGAAGEVSSALPEEREEAMQKLHQILDEYQSEGLISDRVYESVSQAQERNIKQMEAGEQVSDEPVRGNENELIFEASRAGLIFTPEQQRLLQGLDSPEALQRLFQSSGTRYMRNGQIEWDAFYQEVKDIFEDVLSVADSRPNEFFQEAFSPLHEGHFFNVLRKRLSWLGTKIDSETHDHPQSFFADKKVKHKEPITDSDQTKTEAGYPKTKVIRTKTVETTFAEAIGTHLFNRMQTLRQVREHLHNIDAITNMGLGWEQLSQYSDRLTIDHIDWYFHEDADLGTAYNLFMSSLQDEVSTNGDVIQIDFGKRDSTGLNSTERRAYYQLESLIKAKNPDWSDGKVSRAAIQKIRVASAVSVGVTAEFWNVVMTGRMPIGYEKAKDAAGNDIFRPSGSYVGPGHVGYEKMISQLDMDLLLERFGLPKYYNQFRYMFRPRDLDNPPGPYSKDGYFHHGDVYKWALKAQDAFFNGRDDELADFDEKNVFLSDYMRTNCVGLFARGSWRFTEWRAFVQPTVRNGEHDYSLIDYNATLKRMQRAGSFIVKQFLDNIDFKKLDAAGVEALLGIRGRAGSQLTDAEIKSYNKAKAYERILFGQIGRVAKTKFLRLESRRYTPKNEASLRDDLLTYLKQNYRGRYDMAFIETHLYRMYVSALTLAERSTWRDRRNTTTDYTFGEGDLLTHRDELVNFFHEYKEKEIGEFNRNGHNVHIIENDEKFMTTLKGFNRTLDSSLNQRQRWSRIDHSRGKVETLQGRFAKMLSTGDGSSMGDIMHLLGGDDFDMSDFYMQAGGGRPTGRMMGETFQIASKMNPALMKLFNDGIPEFVKGQYADIHALEEAIKKNFAPQFKEIHTAIAMMDKDQADGYVISLALFMERLLGKDRIFRIQGLGGAMDNFWRRAYPTSTTNLMQDFYRNNLNRPTTALNSDQLYAFGHIILNACNISANEEKPHHYEPVKILGKTVGQRRVNEGETLERIRLFERGSFKGIPTPFFRKGVAYGFGHKWHMKHFEKAAGLGKGARWLETYGPAVAAMLLLALFAYMKMALDKNKKK